MTVLKMKFLENDQPFQTSLLLRDRSNFMVTRGTVQNLTLRFIKITFVHGLNWTHVDAAVVAIFGIGYNMYNNKLRSIELLFKHKKKLKLRLNAGIQN